jgi:hypothetical protein
VPFSTALRAYLEAGGDDIRPTLEVEWPEEDEAGRYSIGDLAVPGVGMFEGRITQIQEPTEGVTARFSGIAVLETTVTLADDDRRIMRRLEGAADCRRIVATVKQASPDVPYADWSVALAGIVDRWRFYGGHLIDLVIRTDDRWLESPVFKLPILQAEWEDLPPENRGVWMPQVFGIWDSRGLSDQGLMPTVKVAQRGDSLRWDLVCHGWVQSLPRLYVGTGDSFALASTANYYVNRIFREGEYITLITWGGTREVTPAADQEVRVDCSGLTLDGTIPTPAEVAADPEANLAYNPVAQLRLWLRLYARNLWRFGAYPAEVGINAAAWDAAEEYAERYGLRGAFRLGGSKEQRTALDVVTEWLGNWTMFRPYWTAAGELAMGVLDPRWPGYGTGSYFNLIRDEDKHVLTKYSIDLDPEGIVNRVTAEHLFDAAQNKSWASLEVQDLTQEESQTHDMRMTMGPSSREN